MNIIREYINFERGIDPKKAIGLGMREKIKKMMEEDGWDYYDDYSDNTALRWASYYSHLEIVKWLIDAGADVHAYKYDAYRYTSLY